MRRACSIFIGFVFPAILITYIVLKISPPKILAALSKVDVMWLGLGLLIYFINYVFRAMRFASLVHSQKVSFHDMLKVGCFHSFYNYMLPLRAGEFSYVYYLNRITRTPVMEGLSTLLVSRVMDFISVLLFFPVVLFFLRGQLSDEFTRTIAIFAGGIVVLVVLLFFFVVRGRNMVHVLDRLMEKIGLFRCRPWQTVRRKLVEFHQSFAAIHTKRMYLQLLPISLLIWLSVYGTFYMVILALHVQINFWQVVLLMIMMVPTRLLPLQGVGDLGSHEIGWVIAFRIFGFAEEEALLVAFNSHIIIFVYVLILGLYAILSTRGMPLRRGDFHSSR